MILPVARTIEVSRIKAAARSPSTSKISTW
jgi:hypothetical protein